MKSDWFVSPNALSRARLDQLLSQEQLAKKSGVSVRSIRSYESAEQAVRLETLQCLAKALTIEARDLGAIRAKGESARARPSTAVPASAPPPLPPGNPALPPRSQLETMIDLERAAGLSESPLQTPAGPVPPLTAKRLQDVFTAYALHEGQRFCLTGKVDSTRGIPSEEAKLLGGRAGVASRFHILKEVAPGRPLGVTVHASKAEHTAALLDFGHRDVTLLLRVVVVPGEPTADGPGFSSFITKTTSKRPWTFLVESVTAAGKAETPKVISAKNARRPAKGASRVTDSRS
jgi:transcriptional regulator with XRE-family HTH domain